MHRNALPIGSLHRAATACISQTCLNQPNALGRGMPEWQAPEIRSSCADAVVRVRHEDLSQYARSKRKLLTHYLDVPALSGSGLQMLA